MLSSQLSAQLFFEQISTDTFYLESPFLSSFLKSISFKFIHFRRQKSKLTSNNEFIDNFLYETLEL